MDLDFLIPILLIGIPLLLIILVIRVNDPDNPLEISFKKYKNTKWKVYEYKDSEGEPCYSAKRKVKGENQYVYFSAYRDEIRNIRISTQEYKHSNLEHLFYAIEEINKREKFQNYKKRIK